MALKNQKSRRPVRVIEGDRVYLLRLGHDYYHSTADSGRPKVVPAPSMAAHMSYPAADALCQQFRALNYENAVVCDIYGKLIDHDALAAERLAQEARIKTFWGE